MVAKMMVVKMVVGRWWVGGWVVGWQPRRPSSSRLSIYFHFIRQMLMIMGDCQYRYCGLGGWKVLVWQIPEMQWWDQNHCNHRAPSVETIPAGNLPTNSKLIQNMFSILTGNTDSPHLAINSRQLSASSQTVNHHLNIPLHLNLYKGRIKIQGQLVFFYFQPWRCY